VVPKTSKPEIVFSFLHLMRNLRSQKKNGDLIEEETTKPTVPQTHQFFCLSWIQVFFTTSLDNLT